MATVSRIRDRDMKVLVVGNSPADVRGETDKMKALGFTPSVILWSEVTEEWYEWWYRQPTTEHEE